ncbi:MAG: hypothetical protein UV68_C0019G0001 [Candidatus Collierbacteria bacterium GW2011_GWC2_43_12]|uniref:Fibronectin type-III domain-containing protein n=1 Tax=Candidatus Collierbacteria bacterium GW2011_GWC2_43_12 TaxID=1618390 RepID=A0A0G1D7E0_9BACT|nr:MAG: hypothetical protein UV68_C0019G0001 [Candidatus Collierbacteria bacterium GW2011_GWC2_43_12]
MPVMLQPAQRDFWRTFGAGKKLLRILLTAEILLSAIAPYLLSLPAKEARAASKSLSTTVDWNAGEFVNSEANSSFDNIKLTADGSWQPRVQEAPEWAPAGTGFEVSDGTYVYMMRGAGDNEFYRYFPTHDEWKALPRAPFPVNYGDGVYLNGDIYVIPSNSQDLFYKYNIATETWTKLATLPELFGQAQMTTDGTVIYAMRGNTELYKYDLELNTWTVMRPFTTGYPYGSLVYNNGYLYHLYYVSGVTHLWYRYTIATGAVVAMTPMPGYSYEYNPTWETIGDYLYVPRGYGTNNFYRYQFSTNTWTDLVTMPVPGSNFTPMYHSSDGIMYIFRNGTQEIYRYDVANNIFLGAADVVVNNVAISVGRGSDSFYYNNKLYTIRGVNTRNLYSYDIPTGVWTQLADIPADRQTVYQFTRGAVANGKIYFMLSGYPTLTSQFEVYDIATNTWSTLADTPATTSYSALAYPGTGDYIYAVRGASTLTTWRYSISGNTWDDASMPDLPANITPTLGTSFVSDGTNLYLTLGNGVSTFMKFDIAGNAWSELTLAPFAPLNGADMVYNGNGKILATAGNYDKELWEYNIAGNSWRRLPEMPTLGAARWGVHDGSAIEMDATGSVYILRGASTQYVLKYVPSSFNYPVSGTWTSAINDLGYVSAFGDLTSTTTVPGDSSIAIQTRSSTDRLVWTAWQDLSGTTIQSAAGRYFQTKVTLTASTDRTQTPVLDEIVINYSGDEIAPSSPSTVSALSTQVGGTNLVSGTTYSHISPYFSWTGASDAQTSVAGYYVYFGTNNSANPQTNGTWQTTANYTVTEPLSAGSYYLKIKTKDSAGNISATLDAFNYVYSGIPAEKSFSVSLSSEFASGSATNANLLSDEIKIASKAAGLWLQDRFSVVPAVLYYGAQSMAYVSETNKIYVLRGINDKLFYEYDLGSDTWTALAQSPVNIYTGGGIVEGPSGYLYAISGYNSSTFLRYSIVDNTWDDAAASDAPNTFNYGSALKFDGSRYIYVLRGNADDSFYRYDTLSDTWSSIANTDFGAPDRGPSNLVYDKADLAFDGGDTLYATQGYAQPGFASYSIANNSWTLLPDTPVSAQAGSSIEYDPVTHALYFTPGGGTPDLFKYDVSAGVWSALRDAPAGINYGSDMRLVDDFLVVTQGASQIMWKYKINSDFWQVPTRGVFGKNFYGSTYDSPSYGGAVIKGDGNYLYLTRGAAANDFSRYNTVTGEVMYLAPLPSGANYGQNIVYNSANNKIYFTASLTQKFFVYDIATNSWSSDDALPLLANQYGTTLIYDGSRYIYWTRGGGSSFYRYDYLADSGSRWVQRANIPYAGNSASLVYKDGYIYAVRGDATVSFYRYDVAANTWSDPLVADLPSSTYRGYYGGSLADGGDGYLYFARGENSNHFLRYSISGNAWSVLTAPVPAQVYAGAGIVNGGDGRLYLLASAGTNTFADGVYVYVVPSSTAGFQEKGIYTSDTHSLGDVFKWSNIRLSYTTAEEASLKVETRTSADASTWSGWSQATEQKILNTSTYEYKINSAVNPYIQVRITLTSLRGIRSGVVSDYTINYVQDSHAPTNPLDAGLTVYSTATRSSTIATNTWYPYPSIDITWPLEGSASGATDTATGSGVLGYLVSFEATSGADPLEDGELQTDNNYLTSGLVSGNSYYFALKTQDNAGNTTSEAWQPFIYKFDNVVPTQPTDLEADPSGYSAINNFDFSWGIATDSASGIAGYCYKTGTTSGEFAQERCTTELSLTDVPAYKAGANTFYLRAKDNAGNFSTTTSVAYYFSDDSPSPPANLVVSPETSTTNSFEFDWDAPQVYYGNISNLRYYYSVNALPTVTNVSETPLTNLTAGAYATLPGENTFYVVAKDEAGNIDYKQYAQVSFSANTAAPGMPVNMDIADVSVKATSSWKIAITWQEPTDGAENVATYQVWRSDDGGVTYKKIASTAGISYVDTGLKQLTYFYKVKSCDSANNCGAFGTAVEQYPDGKFIVAPTLVAEPVESSVTTKKATIDWSTDRTADSKVAYGVESGKYLDAEVASSVHVTSHTIGLTNLSPGTTYYYVAKWTDEDGNTGTSEEQTFATSPAPSAKEVSAVNIGLDLATIQFTSAGAYKAKVVYGKTTTFGGVSELPVSSTEATYGVRLEGLEDGVKYYYRVDLYDIDGSEYMGDTYSFETLPRPKILNIKLQQVKGTATSTVLVTWSSNTPISSIVTYYPSSSPSLVKDDVNIILATSHRALIKGLSADAAYTLVVKGRDKGGNEAVSESQSFTTAFDTRAPEISNLNTELSVQGNGEEATAQVVISWETDELSNSQVVFGDGSSGPLSNKTQIDNSQSYTHLVVLPNLSPSKVYHFKAMSADKTNNVGESTDMVIITPKATQSALNLVVGNLSQAFGFLGGLAGGN